MEFVTNMNQTYNILSSKRNKNESNFVNIFANLAFILICAALPKVKTVFKGTQIKKIFFISCLISSILLSPIAAFLLLTCWLYRTVIRRILKSLYKNEFVGLLSGADAVWAVEDISLNVINILILIEVKSDVQQFMNELKKKMLLIIQNKKFEKLQFHRHKKFGYYFWMKRMINIDDHINCLKTKNSIDTKITKKEIQYLISDISNKELPNDHTSSWEILIVPQIYEIANKCKKTYPILFRFHHSLGDGIALIKALVEAADKTPQKKEMIKKYPIKKVSYLRLLSEIIFAPGYLIYTNLLKKVDCSVLHGPLLSGEKIVDWISDDENLLECVKGIKKRVGNVTFFDVILTVLTQTFQEYFMMRTKTCPDKITAVLIERADKLLGLKTSNRSSQNELKNSFTVSMIGLTLQKTGSGCHTFTPWGRLQEVGNHTRHLREALPDYKINYWLLNVVSKLLPEPLLKPLIQSAHSTVAISNIIGPNKLSICNGHLVEDIMFWVPHRGLTGIGISILTYESQLKIGINVDKSLINNQEEIENILKEFVRNLLYLQSITTQEKVMELVSE